MSSPIRVPGGTAQPTSPPAEHARCNHERVEVRKRTQSNGVLIAARQCLACGSNLGAVPKKTLQTVTGLPEWDNDLNKRYWEQRHARVQAATEARNLEWWAWYDDYLRSAKWHAKRDAVLRRDNYVCRGCGTNRAVQVHHLTYARVGREMLFDLVSVCKDCHATIHEQESTDGF